MANVPDRITTIASVNSLDNESESSRGENKPRIERSPFWFILIVLSFTLIPFVNL